MSQHTKMRKARRLIWSSIFAGIAAPALAHHSYIMFDTAKYVTLTGTVREFQWTNPHGFIQLRVPGADAAIQEWSIEMGAPVHMMRGGWTRSTIKAGDKITVVINPLVDGGHGGNFVSATAQDGKTLGSGK